LRRDLLLVAALALAFFCWILVSAVGSYPNIPVLWFLSDPDKDSEPGEALADLYSECPVILGVPTAGAYIDI